MGQANARGTYEERRAQAIGRKQLEAEKAKLEADARAAERQRWYNALPEEQKKQLKDRAKALAAHNATLAGLLMNTIGVLEKKA